MVVTQNALKSLRDRGWARVPSDVHDETVLAARTLAIAQYLGKPVRGRARQIVEALRPKAPETAPPASLSRKYGLDAFPFHVDTAHWVTPARFMILSCVSLGDEVVPTLLLNRNDVNLSSDERNIANSAVFLVKNGRNSFYSSIFGGGREFIRYDPGCMEPQGQDAIKALAIFAHERVRRYVQEFSWEIGDSLIIDNWRMLHARAAAGKNSAGRLLLRCLVS